MNEFSLRFPVCFPAPERPNTLLQFALVDASCPALRASPSPFNPSAWAALLSQYPGPLCYHLPLILCFGALLGYTGPECYRLADNLRSAIIDPAIIDNNLVRELDLHRIERISKDIFPLILSPLGLASKNTGGFRHIHHLSFPHGTSVNDFIPDGVASLKYTTFRDILKLVIAAGRHCTIIKRDIIDAFRNIPVAPHLYWLLGFMWQDQLYWERCPPFGLATAPFIFNLFAEAFHWILKSYLCWEFLAHYLDDFIQILPMSDTISAQLSSDNDNYRLVTDCLGIPRNESKYRAGTSIPVFGLIIDTNHFIARVPKDKLDRIKLGTAMALSKSSVSRHEIESLSGLLSFCAPVVLLGWVFMRPLWNFIAQFPSSPSSQCRVPALVREDLIWWNLLLPAYNGVFFFDHDNRPPIQLYTDASMTGLGEFYYQGLGIWTQVKICQNNAFTSCFDHHDVYFDLTATDTQVSKRHHINTYEVQAILLAFQSWAALWSGCQVTIHTDSSTAFEGLHKHTLKGSANIFLREIFLLAAQNNIFIVPRWLKSEANGLADALSRFKYDTITNLCPHWQYLLNTSVLLPLSLKPFPIDRKISSSSFGTD